jgi:hypothetical protein
MAGIAIICRVTLTKHSRVTVVQQGMPALHLALSLRCSLSTRDAALSIIGHMLAGPSFDPNLRDAALSPPLCTAAAAADAEAIDALIKAGADPTFRDAHGCTPLHLALMSGSASAIALLLPYISPLQQNSDGASCEHLIASLPPSFGVPLPSPPSALADAAGMTAAAAAAAALSPSAASEGPSFLFYDSAATRLHVAEVSFCTEAAARVDVLAGESGVLLDAASRGSAAVISEMPPASLPDLARCHAWSYLSRIRELSQSGGTAASALPSTPCSAATDCTMMDGKPATKTIAKMHSVTHQAVPRGAGHSSLHGLPVITAGEPDCVSAVPRSRVAAQVQRRPQPGG